MKVHTSIKTLADRFKLLRLKIFFALFHYFERRTGKTVSLHVRPLYAKDITRTADALVSEPSCAIVLQGALMQKYDFTLESVRMYKKVYPSLTVIVSTWEGEDAKSIDRLREAGAEVVLSAKPAYFGTWNINLQIVSARNGIQRAKDLGIEYTIKSRTDQRVYARNILETLCNLVAYFPPATTTGLRKRIVVCHEAYKYYNGYFPDMFMFGDTNDLLDYWSVELLKKGASYGEFFSELYLTYSFCRRKGWHVPDSIRAIRNIYRDCVIVLDWDALDLLWLKYDYFWSRRYNHKERYQEMSLAHKFIEVNFAEWFNIFSNGKNKAISPIQEAKFAHYLKTVNFSDYERNFED